MKIVIVRQDGLCYDGSGQWVDVEDVTLNFGEDLCAAERLLGSLRQAGHNVNIEWDEL